MAATKTQLLSVVFQVQIFDVLGPQEGLTDLTIVMELADGGDLRDRIDTGNRMGERQCQSILLQLLEAIEHLHLMNVLHRGDAPCLTLPSSPPVVPCRSKACQYSVDGERYDQSVRHGTC